MISEKMMSLGKKSSVIREIFEYGKKRKAEIGAENVFDFSLGNPSVPAPKEVTEIMKEFLETVPAEVLHGYTSGPGDIGVRTEIANYINNKLLHIKKTSYTSKVNGKNTIIIDKPKTKKSNRIIPIPDKLLVLLQIQKRASSSNYIITTKQNKMVETRSYQRTFESILSKCGIKHYNFHCLRHTFATRALELGMDIKTLSEILGHTNVAITLNRYAHSLLEYKIQEMNKIGTLL